MFSYTDSIQKLVSKEIFQRGVKIYLEGKVVSKSDLVINFWRKYKVLGASNDFYFVQIPILHLALDSSKYHLVTQAILESCSCTCPYFAEFGVCKHFVAVFHDLEKEYFGNLTKKSFEIDKSTSILDTIFVVEKVTKQKNLRLNIDFYFEKSSQNSVVWWEKFIFDVEKNPTENKKILADLKVYFLNALLDYDNEKKLLYLIFVSIKLSGDCWWDFWLDILPSLSLISMRKFWLQVWKIRFLGLTKSFDTKINNLAKGIAAEEKTKILESLQTEYENNREIWLDFVLSSQHSDFLEKNLDKFDAELLLDICEILPEKREEIEIKIMKQIEVWSDYLPVGNYSDFQKVLEKWKKLGGSDYLVETVKYIKIQHKKKPKLMSFLRKLL